MIKLRELCLSKYGLICQKTRQKVWPILLNLESAKGVKGVFEISSDSGWKSKKACPHTDKLNAL